jgi:hypothetical protein
MQNNKKTKIIYYEEVSDNYFLDKKDRGYLSISRVELPDGKQYPLYFYDATILKSSFDRGRRFFAKPGLIIIPEITKEHMENAVEELYEQGYFDHLRPMTGKLLVEHGQNLDSRTNARFAFNSIVNDYLKLKRVGAINIKVEESGWLITLVDGTKVLVVLGLCLSESADGSKFEFEITYDQKRGGVIAVKFLPGFVSDSFDILIPNSQIAQVEKES